MYAQNIPYKQIESFGLSTSPNGDDLPNRNKFPRWNAQGKFNPITSLSLNFNYQAESTSTFGALGATAGKYNGCVSDPSGRYIYGLPNAAGNICKIDTLTDTVSTFGSGISTGYLGGVLFGQYIYAIPYTAQRILKIDTTTDTYSFIGPALSIAGSAKYHGSVLAPNGNIYGIPRDATQVIKVNPITDTYTYFGQVGTGTNKWMGGVLAGDYIYCIPYDDRIILKICWIDDTVSAVDGLLPNLGNKYIGGAIAVNGNIYACPYNANNVLKINPYTNTFSTFGTPGAGTTKYACIATSSNNSYLYCCPSTSSTVLRIDTENDTITTFGSLGATAGKWVGISISVNGSLYCVPSASATSTVLKILTSLNENLDSDFVANRHFNKY